MKNRSKLYIFLAFIPLFLGNVYAADVLDVTAPKVYAGKEIYYKNSIFSLNGEASDIESGILGYSWTKQSGPGNLVFSDQSGATTSVSADKDGTYVIRLVATNSIGLSSYDEITLVWDTSNVIINEITPIPSTINYNQPKYTFLSSKDGFINYYGSCSSAQKSSIKGNNTIIFNKLNDNTYTDCSINVTDKSSNNSNTLILNPFKIDTIAPISPKIDNIVSPTTLNSQIVSGTKEQDSSVWLNNKEIIPMNSSTTWSYKVNLNIGPNTLVVFSKDDAGNSSKIDMKTIIAENPVCNYFSYSPWSDCVNGQQIRYIVSASPANCVDGASVLNQICNSNSNQSNNQTNQTCTSFDYSDWSPCSNNNQIRYVTRAYPDNCASGNPLLARYCADNSTSTQQSTTTTNNQTCIFWNYSDWSDCTNGLQNRSITFTFPIGCGGGNPTTSRTCSSSTSTTSNTTTTNQQMACTYFSYSPWSDCSNGNQVRTISTSLPSGCTGGNPIISQTCTVVNPLEKILDKPKCTSWTYSDWSECINSEQVRTVKTSLPADCAGGTPALLRVCDSTTNAIDNSNKDCEFVSLEKGYGKSVDEKILAKVKGQILLQIQEKGQGWYINPDDSKKYFLGRPATAFAVMRKFGLGITNKDYNKFELDGAAPLRLSGKIIIKVEDSGKAYYIDPKTLKMYFLGRPNDAFNVMRNLGLGITNDNLRKIETGDCIKM